MVTSIDVNFPSSFAFILRQVQELYIQWRKLPEKKVHSITPKGNMGYDSYTVPDIVAVEATFVGFL